MVTHGPTLGSHCKGQTKALSTSDLKSATRMQIIIPPLDPAASLTRAAAAQEQSDLTCNGLTPTSVLETGIERIPDCVLGLFLFFLNIHTSPPPIQHTLTELTGAKEISTP